MSSLDRQDLEDYCTERVEDTFGDMLLKALDFINKVYGINTDWTEISENVFLKITYNGDDKTFLDRIKKYCTDYKITKNKVALHNNFRKLLGSECEYIFNHVLANEVGNSAIEYEIFGEATCKENGGPCEEHLGAGISTMNTFKPTDIPPYHSECKCQLIFYLDISLNELGPEIEGENLE